MNLAEGLKSYEKNLPVLFCLAEAFLYCALKFWSRAFRVLAGQYGILKLEYVNIALFNGAK